MANFRQAVLGCLLSVSALIMSSYIPALRSAATPVPITTSSTPTAQSSASTQAAGFSPFSPAPVGTTIETAVRCGEEPCDTKIILLDVLRGEKAWDLVKAANSSSKSPDAGFEYLLVRIKFELSSRTPGDKHFELTTGPLGQFAAFSADGKPYETPSIELPEPELSGTLRSGESREGWLAFLVQKADNKPLMTFSPASGAARGQGKVVWFRLSGS